MIRLVIALALLPAAGFAQGYAIHRYTCEDGGEVTAVYPSGFEDVILTVDGYVSVLRHSISGSGVRYTPPEYLPGYVWWTKGDSAMVNVIDSDSGEERSIYTDCTLVEEDTAFDD